MPLLKPALQKEIRRALAEMTGHVTLVVFTTDTDAHACEMCDDTRQLVEEVAWLSEGRITAKIYDLARDAERARALDIDMAPAVAVLGNTPGAHDYRIRFFGIPSGYELASLISAIVMVSTGKPSLAAPTIKALSRLAEPLRIQVFVTPTCPYCPSAVTLAHRLAVASPHVTAEMVDASEFPELSDRFGVRAVPHTVINGSMHVEGAVPEDALMEKMARWTTASAAS